MMFERFTPGARTIVIHAQQHARRLGHRYIGPEHLLLGLAGLEEPAGAVLREYGITPEYVEEEIVRRAGLGAGAGLFVDLDQDALSVIGIDLDAVRARVEASFGTGALARASQAVHQRPRPSRLNPRRAVPPRLRRRRHRARVAAPAALAAPAARPAPATGRYQAPGSLPTGHIPFTPAAKRNLETALRECLAQHGIEIGAQHVALSVISTSSGLVPPIVSAAGSSVPALRTAILDRYRQAG
jgi:ATP-dependent Clp protease ATP-binding subunit ClpA